MIDSSRTPPPIPIIPDIVDVIIVDMDKSASIGAKYQVNT